MTSLTITNIGTVQIKLPTLHQDAKPEHEMYETSK